MFRSKLEHKAPVTECSVCLRMFFVFYGEMYIKNGSCVRFCWHNILFLRSRVSLLQNDPLSKPQTNFWRKNRLCHEARWFCAEKSSGSFTTSCSFIQRLQRLSEAVVVEPVKRKTSEFIWFKLTLNRDFNGENFFSLSVALLYDPFRSMANNWHQYCKLIFRIHRLSHSAWNRYHLIQ